MKKFKKFLIFIFIAILMQFSFLFYIDRYKLAYDSVKTTYTASNKDNQVDKKTFMPKKDKTDISIPEGIDKLKVSSDGRYVGYLLDNALNVIDTKEANKKSIQNSKDSGIVEEYSFLKEDMVLVIEKNKDKEQEKPFNLYYYNLKNGDKIKIKDNGVIRKNTKITAIECSPLKNLVYIKCAYNSSRANIYKINAQNELEKLETKSTAIGKIKVVPHEDKIIYEDSMDNKLYVSNIDKKFTFKKGDKVSLLCVDEEDEIYIGKFEEEKVSGIYYGLMNENLESWKWMSLKETVEEENLKITAKGEIYVHDVLKGQMKNIITDKTTDYPGKFVQIYNNGIVSLSQGNLVKTEFK